MNGMVYSRDSSDYLVDRGLYVPRVAETEEEKLNRRIKAKEAKVFKRQDRMGLQYNPGYSGIMHVSQIASVSFSNHGLMQWHYNFKLKHSRP